MSAKRTAPSWLTFNVSKTVGLSGEATSELTDCRQADRLRDRRCRPRYAFASACLQSLKGAQWESRTPRALKAPESEGALQAAEQSGASFQATLSVEAACGLKQRIGSHALGC